MSRSRRRGRVVRQRPAKPRTAVRICSAPSSQRLALGRAIRPKARRPLDSVPSAPLARKNKSADARRRQINSGELEQRRQDEADAPGLPAYGVRAEKLLVGRMENGDVNMRHAAVVRRHGPLEAEPPSAVGEYGAAPVPSVSVRSRLPENDPRPGDGRAARRHDASLQHVPGADLCAARGVHAALLEWARRLAHGWPALSARTSGGRERERCSQRQGNGNAGKCPQHQGQNSAMTLVVH